MRTWIALVLLLLACAPAARAVTVPPPPDPGLEASVHAADIIVEVEILSGGPYQAAAEVKRVFKGDASKNDPPGIIELVGYNSINWDTVHRGFRHGGRFILFLSRTHRPGEYATLTPSAPRLPVNDDRVLLSLGDPPFRIPIPADDMARALKLMLEQRRTGKTPAESAAMLKAMWDRQEIELRYLAAALAGFLREAAAVPLLKEATANELLRLRLTALDSLAAIGTPEALDALRPLLQDKSSTLSREAARALIERRDFESVDVLLDWGQRAAKELEKMAQGDRRRTSFRRMLNALFLWLEQEGALLPPERIVPTLLELARNKDSSVATDALYLSSIFAGPAQIHQLIALADDPVYPLRQEAQIGVIRATLRLDSDLDRLRAWWKEARSTFGEAHKKTVVDAAVRALRSPLDDIDERRRIISVLRAAPGEMALVAVAPLLLNTVDAGGFETLDLTGFRTPLALPFLIERMGWDTARERGIALDGLTFLAQRNPRLLDRVRPYVHASLVDEFSSLRRSAAAAAGQLRDAQTLPVLIGALDAGGYEATAARNALYELTARTMGYGKYEPEDENEAAVARFGGWWAHLGEDRAAWQAPFPGEPPRAASPTWTFEKLKAVCQGESSRPSGAAFGVLFNTRGPDDPLWLELMASERPRDRAYAALGAIGGGGAWAPKLGALITGEKADTELVQACALTALATLKDPAGPGWIVDWLNGAGTNASPAMRRMALSALALSDGEARSRGYLAGLVAQYLKAAANPDPALRPTPLIRAAVTALCAREDGGEALIGMLKAGTMPLRETALRSLVARGETRARTNLLEALARADRYYVAELARLAAPLLTVEHAAALRAMLANHEDVVRLAAAHVLAARPELGRDGETVDALIAATADMLDEVQSAAATALGKLRVKRAARRVADLLQDDTDSVKTAAAEALALIGDRTACQMVAIEAQNRFRLSPKWLPALAVHGGETEMEMLLSFSRKGRSAEQRYALHALGFNHSPQATQRLLEVFHDNGSSYQSHAGFALAEQVRPAAEMLRADLASKDSAVRGRAIHVLAHIPSRVAADALVGALGDEEPGLRALADWGLRRLTGKDAKFDPRTDEAKRAAAAGVWKQLIDGVTFDAAP